MKLFTSKHPPAAISRQEALRCVPSRNSSVITRSTENGTVLLEYPLQLRPLFRSLLQRLQKDYSQPTRKLELDTLGSAVWHMIDGKTTVKEIVRQFAGAQNLTIEEAEQSVTLFLAELGKRGIIALA